MNVNGRVLTLAQHVSVDPNGLRCDFATGVRIDGRRSMGQPVMSGASHRKHNPMTEPSRWVDLYGDVLFGYAALRVPSRDIAEDLVQETFLAALRTRDTFAGDSSEQTWLVSILRRKIADHFRDSVRRKGRGIGTAEQQREQAADFDRGFGWRR